MPEQHTSDHSSEQTGEARNPALHNGENYHKGSIEQAIADARKRDSFLVIFLKGGDHESYIADETLHVSLGWSSRTCIALRIHDDLDNLDENAFTKGKAFREIFPTVGRLPFLMTLSPDGRPLASLQGAEVAQQCTSVLREAAAKFPGKGQISLGGSGQRSSQLAWETTTSIEGFQSHAATAAASEAPPQLQSAMATAAAGAQQRTPVEALGQALLLASQYAAQTAATNAPMSIQPQHPEATGTLLPGQAAAPSQDPSGAPKNPRVPGGPACLSNSGAGDEFAPNSGVDIAQPAHPPIAMGSTRSPDAEQETPLEDAEPSTSASGFVAVEAIPAIDAPECYSGPAVEPLHPSLSEASGASGVQDQDVAAEAKSKAPLQASPGLDRLSQDSPSKMVTSTSPLACLSIRLTDGTFLRSDFRAEALLGEVMDLIDAARQDGQEAYVLRTPFPHRLLDGGNRGQSLVDLDLCPRSMLALQSVSPAAKMEQSGVLAIAIASIRAWFTGFTSLILGFFFGIFRVHDLRTNGQTAGSEIPASAAPASKQHNRQYMDRNDTDDATPFKGGTVYEGGAGASSSQLKRRQPKDGREDEGNTYVNGNSTEFKGGD